MSNLAAGIVLAVGASHLLYVYGGYAYLLRLMARLRGRSREAFPHWPDSEDPPNLTVYVGARNEEEIIGPRLANIVDTTYPIDRLEIIVVADGCTDATVAEVHKFHAANPAVRLRLHEEPVSLGKWAAQNFAASHGWGDVLVSTDAETTFERETLAQLAAPFADDTVGVVGGRVFYQSTTSELGDSYNAYRDVEHSVRAYEMANGILMKSDGPCVAYRRRIWQQIEQFEDVDHVICYFARFAGLRSVYNAQAVAFDKANTSSAQDIKQRTRMTRKFFLTHWKRWSWRLWLSDPAFSWAIYSHRTARLLSPLWLACCAVSVLWLIAAGGGRLQVSSLVVAVGLGVVLAASSRVRSVAGAFFVAQAGFANGVLQVLRGDRTGGYTPTRKLA